MNCYILKLILTQNKLPKLSIHLGNYEKAKEHYQYFMKRHPKYIIIRNKQIGVAVIETNKTYGQYLTSLRKYKIKYLINRANKIYRFDKIAINDFIDDVHEINSSCTTRQGKSLPELYLKKHEYNTDDYIDYGIFKDDALVAYLRMKMLGECAIIDTLLGHWDHLKNGIMYLLVMNAMCDVWQRVKYITYDTFFNLEGLRHFKKQFGFTPYYVNWTIDEQY